MIDMDFIHALILGIVEGITEFLPISSTGHLILTNRLLGLSSTDFVKSFEIIIQLGAIGAIIALYWRKLLINWEVMKRIIVGFAPTAVLGLIFYKAIKQLLGGDVVVLWALGIGGLLLILFEKLHTESAAEGSVEQISYKQAFLIGTFQAFAFIPGVSRSAATIIGGLALGLRRTVAVEFSFLLSVPTMLAASLLDIYKNGGAFSSDQFGLLAVGFVTAFIVALIAVKFLLRFVRTHNLVSFGVYRIVLTAIFFIFILR
jgi:undecaprenyl-diphosphatase